MIFLCRVCCVVYVMWWRRWSVFFFLGTAARGSGTRTTQALRTIEWKEWSRINNDKINKVEQQTDSDNMEWREEEEEVHKVGNGNGQSAWIEFWIRSRCSCHMGCSLLEDEQRQWQRGTSNGRSIWQTKKNKEEKEFTRRILFSPLPPSTLFFPLLSNHLAEM